MAAANYPINQNASKDGRDLVDELNKLGNAYANILRLHQAAAEARDGVTDVDASFATPALLFGYVATVGATDSSVSGAQTKARAGWNEVASMIAVCDAALKQCTSRFKQ